MFPASAKILVVEDSLTQAERLRHILEQEGYEVAVAGNGLLALPRAEARIEIGSAGEEDGRVVLFVRDNGVGSDMKYADKLFGVFQRLHRADEFEGMGLGLATVMQIVAKHGGRTWAQGEPGGGARFYLTLSPERRQAATLASR